MPKFCRDSRRHLIAVDRREGEHRLNLLWRLPIRMRISTAVEKLQQLRATCVLNCAVSLQRDQREWFNSENVYGKSGFKFDLTALQAFVLTASNFGDRTRVGGIRQNHRESMGRYISFRSALRVPAPGWLLGRFRAEKGEEISAFFNLPASRSRGEERAYPDNEVEMVRNPFCTLSRADSWMDQSHREADPDDEIALTLLSDCGTHCRRTPTPRGQWWASVVGIGLPMSPVV